MVKPGEVVTGWNSLCGAP